MYQAFISRNVEETSLSKKLAKNRLAVSKRLPSFKGNGTPQLFNIFSKILDGYRKQSDDVNGSFLSVSSSDEGVELKSNFVQNMPYDEVFEVEDEEKIEHQRLMVSNYGLKMSKLIVSVEFKDKLIESQLDDIVALRRKEKIREFAHQNEVERLQELLREKEDSIHALKEENKNIEDEKNDEVNYNKELKEKLDGMKEQSKKTSNELKELSEDLLECQTQCFKHANEAQELEEQLENLKKHSLKACIRRFFRALTSPTKWCRSSSAGRRQNNKL